MTTADQEVESAPLVTSLNGSGGQNNNKGHNTKKAFNKEQQQPNNNSDYTTDKDATPFILLGTDISHYKREQQYAICACSLFSFSLLYGYLQELITVQMFSRDLALFLSTVQFAGYTLLVYVLRNYVYPTTTTTSGSKKVDGSANHTSKFKEVPPYFYVSIALLRALEMGLTNLAMQYINFPAKTLLKSSRIIFTMFFGLFIQRKKYRLPDYLTVVGMAIGLALFLRADSKSAAVFHYMGVVMLVLSLFCDGAMVNLSETIMTKYGVGQDEVCTHARTRRMVVCALLLLLFLRLDAILHLSIIL